MDMVLDLSQYTTFKFTR